MVSHLRSSSSSQILSPQGLVIGEDCGYGELPAFQSPLLSHRWEGVKQGLALFTARLGEACPSLAALAGASPSAALSAQLLQLP